MFGSAMLACSEVADESNLGFDAGRNLGCTKLGEKSLMVLPPNSVFVDCGIVSNMGVDQLDYGHVTARGSKRK